MADERLWYLNLSDLGITDGKPIEVNESVDCEQSGTDMLRSFLSE